MDSWKGATKIGGRTGAGGSTPGDADADEARAASANTTQILELVASMFRTRVEAGHHDLQDLLGPRLLAEHEPVQVTNIKEKMIMIMIMIENFFTNFTIQILNPFWRTEHWSLSKVEALTPPGDADCDWESHSRSTRTDASRCGAEARAGSEPMASFRVQGGPRK